MPPLQTGNLGNTSLLYFAPSTGASLWVSLQINSTNSANRKGFKASFIKFYAGTTITGKLSLLVNALHKPLMLLIPLQHSTSFLACIVPSNSDLPTTPPLGIAATVDTKVIIELDSKDVGYVVTEMARRGYKVVSLSSYRLGYGLETIFDVIFSNSSLVDTVPYIQLTESQLLAQIVELGSQGYAVSSISGRVASDGVLYYSGVFRAHPPIVETKVFLGDSETIHLKRLTDLKNTGHQLVAQSLETVDEETEACSVYTRDIRLSYNISVDTKPPNWISFFNTTFYQFTGNLLKAVSQYSPIHIDVYHRAASSSPLFSAVLLEYPQSQWFVWDMNYNRTLTELEGAKLYWEPVLSLGYNSNLGNEVHYVQWQRKSQPEYATNKVPPGKRIKLKN